jgi:hypothetical protein
VKHPGRTKAQRAILDQVGCGENCPRGTRKVLDAMVDEGLLVRLPDKVLGQDALGVIALPQFEMPIPVHYAWCSYWAEQDAAEALA